MQSLQQKEKAIHIEDEAILKRAQCQDLLESCYGKVDYLKMVFDKLGLQASKVVIVITQIDDKNGKIVTKMLSNPRKDYCNECTETISGIAKRELIAEICHDINIKAEKKLRTKDCLCVVVIGFDTAEVFTD